MMESILGSLVYLYVRVLFEKEYVELSFSSSEADESSDYFVHTVYHADFFYDWRTLISYA